MDFETVKNQILHPENLTMQFDPSDMMTNKAAGIFASIPGLFWIPLVACKDSAYGKFCANQGLIFFILDVALSIMQGVAGFVLQLIPFVGGLFLGLLHLFCGAVMLCIFLMLFVSACQGQARKIPFIGNTIDAFH